MPSSSNAPEYRHTRTGSLSIPPQNGHANGIMSPMAGASNTRFDGPRSPPNTGHVPCKFFRQGTCQAGNACPFSHDIGAAAENVCKYFAKGNCKFGPKCANIHVLPDGRRINYSKNGVTFGAAPISLGSRVNPTTYLHSSNSALTNSFMRADSASPYSSSGPFSATGEERFHQLGRQPSLENGLPTIDTTYSSNPTSVYGSPREDDSNRLGLGLSPVNTKVLSVLDAPLPASFDSNGISHAARYGPWPSSVPTKFGLESPSSSLHNAKESRTSETLKRLHTSAFGSSEHLSPSYLPAHEAAVASSPPANAASEECFGKKAMHSSSQRFAKPRMMTNSVPKVVDRDWDNEFLFLQEDYVPGSLANDVLTPQEKARRMSIRVADGEPLADTPPPSVTKFGSPANGASPSPSRWGSLFQRQREEELESGSIGRSMKHAASAFGHVGSPLRNSSLAIDAEYNGAGDRNRSTSESLSVLSQQLQRTRLSEDGAGSSSPHLHPNAARTVSSGAGIGIIGKDRDRDRALERHVSSGSIGSSANGRIPYAIDEEDPAFVFSMEEEDDAQLRAMKRKSSGASWSYLGITAKNAAKGQGSSSIVETVNGR